MGSILPSPWVDWVGDGTERVQVGGLHDKALFYET